MSQKGTPKTLGEAIDNALEDLDAHYAPGALHLIKIKLHHHVQDFLAQKFTAAHLSYETESNVLTELFNSIALGYPKPGSDDIDAKEIFKTN